MQEDAYDLFREGCSLLDKRCPAHAASFLERAKVLEPGKGSILETLGIAYYRCGDHEGAKLEFEAALEVDPTNHYARYALSRCLHRKGMLHQAIGQVKLAAVMAPSVDFYDHALRRYQWELDTEG
jgi:tetratricopeptide (TPR) repeat protein